MPKVSVIIPALNAGRTITAALESVFTQTWRDFEVIVVDRGSNDDTRSCVESKWPDRVTYIGRHEGDTARARNEALRIARGQLIAFLGAEDMWLPRKLEWQVAYFTEFATAGLLHTPVFVTDRPSAARRPGRDSAPNCALRAPANRFYEIFHGHKSVISSSVMLKRSVLADLGDVDEQTSPHAQDWELWLRVAAKYPVGYLPVPLAIRRTPGVSCADGESTLAAFDNVINRVAPLCAMACTGHPGDPEACLAERRHQLYSQRGYQCFWEGNAKEARMALARALALRPDDVRARCYYAATFVGSRWLRPVRQFQAAGGTDAVSAPPMPANLVHDTVYRRTRRSLTRLAHDVDDAVSGLARRPTRLLFEAASPMSVAVFRPVLDRLRQDPRIEFWFTSADESWDARAIFAGLSDAAHLITPAVARWMKFDGYVNTDFWSTTWLPRRARRVHLFHGVAGKYGLDAPVGIAPVVAAFDRLLFPNRDRLQRYAEAGILDADSPQAALVGYPKVDCLVDGSLDRLAIERSLRLRAGTQTIVYAPTWSPQSSLHGMGVDVIKALSRLDANVIVKLHDRSCDRTERGAGGVDWRTRLSGLCRDLGVHLADDADASPYLYVADALVTDHSSIGFEFMLLDRPLIVIDCPELVAKARISTHKVEMLRSAAFLAGRTGEVAAAVQRGLLDPAAHSARRRDVAAELFYCAGGATARATECIYDLLGLKAPDHATTPLPSHPPVPTLARTC
jgi:hypothetical protein